MSLRTGTLVIGGIVIVIGVTETPVPGVMMSVALPSLSVAKACSDVPLPELAICCGVLIEALVTSKIVLVVRSRRPYLFPAVSSNHTDFAALLISMPSGVELNE